MKLSVVDADSGLEEVSANDSDSSLDFQHHDEVLDSPAGDIRSSDRQAKRKSSFKDLLMKPLRSRKSSSATSASLDEDGRKKRKEKASGCAGWLEKRSHRRVKEESSSSGLEEENAEEELAEAEAAVAAAVLRCARCDQPDEAEFFPKGVTYTKREAPPDAELWLCPQCVSQVRRTQPVELIVPLKVEKLADLAMTVLKLNPQVFTLTNLSSLRKREDLGPNGVEDMIAISDLNEASLLWNLKTRYDNQNIYTYTGSILIAVNPYRMFDIYGLDMVKKYDGQILGTLPPHLFAVGSAAYGRMMGRNGEPQAIIISGESGAGKTESTKLIMQYLAAVNKSTQSASSLVTEQILEAAPLLESFGNAKTVRNDNSSRFGKYTQIYFRNGVIAGAKITEYLLEKSRIVTHAAGERNYHVFYEILNGLSREDKARYGLTTAENYFYLNQGGSCENAAKNDKEDFQQLLSAMQVLGLSSEEQDMIFRILASVLHLGNVYFHRKPLKHGQEGVEMGSDAELRWVSHLLQLHIDGIAKALTTKTTEARNERLYTPLNIDQALDARDAVAKALYSSLFGWLVNRVNSIINKGERSLSINILDIFGFEDFMENSFEQLCINYANENLQFHFNKHVFKLEQQEYAKEKIEWQTINFTDNQPVINLIAKKPIGILHLLDDESNFPKATDSSFLEKCHYNHALNELYFRPRMSSMEFGVKHYAGQVWYNVDGFLDKNRDTLRTDVVDLLISSKIPMISKMFQELKKTHESGKTVNKGDGRFITMKPRTATVAARFHDSLHALLDSMAKCNPWFVRCVKPNHDKAPMRFDMPVVLEQLRYTGMLETIRIRKMGYPVRLKFKEFVERYSYLLPMRERRSLANGTPSRDICRSLLERKAQSDQYQMGTTKLFLRENLEQQLERQRLQKLNTAAVAIQRRVRGCQQRKRYTAMKRSAVVIQSYVRRYLARRRFLTIRRGIVRAQANYRATRQRRLYKELRRELKRRAEVEQAANQKAQQRAANEEQERVAKAAAGFNHLEIPAELAFIYSKLDDWHPLHTERNVVKVVGSVPTGDVQYKLPADLDHHAFTKFTNIYFKSHLWGAKKEAIKTPLLPKSNDADFQDSLAIFKLIMRFMNEPNLSVKKEMALGNYIVNKGIVNEKLRDEIFCQICNQTWKNDDSQAVERGWILMANCLSAFPPSPVLYKYLLKYVSDHAYDNYRAICQQKLLQSYSAAAPLSRTYPPTMLEWKANRKCVNMALEARCSDGESRHAGVESWSTAEKAASLLLRSRGLEASELEGWTLSLTHQDDLFDLNGNDFVLDVLAELETPPAFPVNRSQFLNSQLAANSTEIHHLRNQRISGTGQPTEPVASGQGGEEGQDPPMGLSRHSALNHRYFGSDETFTKTKSRSLDNLLSPEGESSGPLAELGLSRSRLNDRYKSVEKISKGVKRSESQNYRRPGTATNDTEWSRFGLSGSSALNSRYFSQQNLNALPNDSDSDTSVERDKPRRKKSFANKSNGQSNGGARSALKSDGTGANTEGSDSEYAGPRDNQPRYIKSQQAGKKAVPGSHASRAYIETRNSEQRELKSSALSDTSETLSLSSHVRRVRVPSQSSDVDQYLDDLFMPVLDGNDEYSDARSLAASIKGTRSQGFDISHIVDDILDTIDIEDTIDCETLAASIKGGGKGVNGVDSNQRSIPEGNFQSIGLPIASPPPPLMPGGVMSPPPLMLPGMPPIPMYASAGYNMPGAHYPPLGSPLVPTPDISALQQNFSRAFIQSAVAQNIQIQQQLMAQNQALQQLLQSPVLPVAPLHPSVSIPMMPNPTVNPVVLPFRPTNSLHVVSTAMEHTNWETSPHSETFVEEDAADLWNIDRSSSRTMDQVPPPVLPKSRKDSFSENSRPSFSRVQGDNNNASMSRKLSHGDVFKGAPPPPPPPLPPEPIYLGDPTAPRPFMDPYGRAKTVRIGKWRWPPPRDDGAPALGSNFFEFKMQKQHSGQNQNRKRSQDSQDSFGGIEWDTFDIEEPRRKDSTPSKPSPVQPVKDSSRELSPPHVKDAPSKPPGSIGKLKISSEMRAKLELVTSGHSGKSSQPEPSSRGSSEEPVSSRKLEDHRRLLQQQQLAGRKWDSVEEVERLTRRASSEEKADLIKAVHQRPQMDQVDRARRCSEISSSQARSSLFETAIQPPSSPPTTYYSPSSTPLILADRDRKTSASTFHTDRTGNFEDSSEFLRSAETHNFSLEDDMSGALDNIPTKLHGPLNAPFFTYNNVPWTLHVRKEVFCPSESLSHPLAIHLVFCQVVHDTFDSACLRIGREDRAKMKQMLENYGITKDNANAAPHKVALKRNVIENAKEWPLYFARLYPVSGGRQNPEVQILAVSHSGVRLAKRESSPAGETLRVLQTYGFSDLSSVSSPRSSTLQVDLRTGTVLQFFSHKASIIRGLIIKFANEAEKEPHEYVRAVGDYVTRESTLLSFRKGDIIRLVHNHDQYLDKGWLFGSLEGRTGIFPADYVEPMSRHEARKFTRKEDSNASSAMLSASPGPHDNSVASLEASSLDNSRLDTDAGSPTQPNDGKHSLLQFALLYFRQSPEKFDMLRGEDGSQQANTKSRKGKNKKSKDREADWTWKEQVDMVKFTRSPIQASLLNLDSAELNKIALECFVAIMRYMGDYPMAKGQAEVDCVYTLLMNCHKHEPLRDEVYCQIMKQTTNNKSSRPDSCQRGWRLFSIVAAYFNCSELLRPFLFKYLETAAYDKRRAYHGTAMVCLQNFRKTLRYGGRKNVPSIEEITAITAGRNSKRQIYRLPGGTERVINTKSTSVVQDIIEEICGVINVRSEHEMEEYSLYCIVEGDTFTMPLAREEYILDVTTELQKNQQVYYLIFCRSVWHFPMRLDNPLYIEIVFNQIAPDYLEGLLLVMPGEQISQDCVFDIAKVAALLHRAADLDHMPTMKETKYLLPKPALSVRDIKPPQWVNLVQSSWKEVEQLKPSQAKAQVLEVLQKWPLFGSSFFAIRKVSDPAERAEYILALNRNGVHFLDVITHETLLHYSYSEVISTRKVKSEDGLLYLDMKCGNLMQQRITRIQTEQAHEISRLIRQYITIQQREQSKDDNTAASR